jgi:hypothetical protein
MRTKDEVYIMTQERIFTRSIFAILSRQKEEFAKTLEAQDREKGFVDDFWNTIREEVPDYLFINLKRVIKKGASEPIKRYSQYLPEGYSIRFDIDASPASKYIRDMRSLHLSDKQGSIGKTTKDELKRIIADGVEQGLSYSAVAKQIRETDPFVFSKSRAELIAVNEIGRAYGFGTHEPARVLVEDEGYVMEKKWITSQDDKVRKAHKENEAA